MSNKILKEMENEFGPVTTTKTPNEVKKSVNNIINGNTPATPVMEGSQEAIHRRNAIQIGSFDKVYKEFIELHKKLKENTANPATKLATLQSDYYALQKKRNETMSSYNRINKSKVSVRGLSSMNSKKADIVSKLAEIRGNIEKRQRAIPLNENTNALNNGSLSSLYPNMNSFEAEEQPAPPSASAAAPAPVPAPPPTPQTLTNATRRARMIQLSPVKPPQVSQSGSTRKTTLNPFENNALKPNALKPNAQLPSTERQTVLAGTGKTRINSQPIRITNAPPVNMDLLGTLEKRYNIVPTQNNTRKRVETLKSTMEEKHAKYIQTMPDKTVYKVVDMDLSNETAEVAPLNRTTKTWGPVEQLTKEQINSSRVVECNSQAGGKRTRRRRPQRKHRKTRRA